MTQLSELGTALWGEYWRLPMARALGTHPRTVTRWQAGQNPVPAWVVPRLTDMLRQHQARIALYLAAHDSLISTEPVACPKCGLAWGIIGRCVASDCPSTEARIAALLDERTEQ